MNAIEKFKRQSLVSIIVGDESIPIIDGLILSDNFFDIEKLHVEGINELLKILKGRGKNIDKKSFPNIYEAGKYLSEFGIILFCNYYFSACGTNQYNYCNLFLPTNLTNNQRNTLVSLNDLFASYDGIEVVNQSIGIEWFSKDDDIEKIISCACKQK